MLRYSSRVRLPGCSKPPAQHYPDYLPSLAIGAFAGLRSAEIERLGWQDIDFASRHIVVSASNAKTASRRIVPLCDNLAEWLRPYSGRQQGKVWPGRIHSVLQAPATDCARNGG